MKPLHLPPLSLYIHLPWCDKKCPYCDLIHTKKQEIPEDAYIEALLEDLKCDQHFAQGRSIQTIFIGGGTPSLFKAKSIQKIIKGVGISFLSLMMRKSRWKQIPDDGTRRFEQYRQWRHSFVVRDSKLFF